MFPIPAYNACYKGFKKTYHVQLQLESVALKGRSIPRVAALMEAMFMAELFQSPPNLSVGCYRLSPAIMSEAESVSIPTQPLGWVLRYE